MKTFVVVSVDEIVDMFAATGFVFAWVGEVKSLFGKLNVFQRWCNKLLPIKDTHNVLIDDALGNTVYINKDLNIVTETINVKTGTYEDDHAELFAYANSLIQKMYKRFH